MNFKKFCDYCSKRIVIEKFQQLQELYDEKEQEVQNLQERIDELEENNEDYSDDNSFDSYNNRYNSENDCSNSDDDNGDDCCENCEKLDQKLTFRNKLYGNVSKSLGDLRKEYSNLKDQFEEMKIKYTNLQLQYNYISNSLQEKELSIISLEKQKENFRKELNKCKSMKNQKNKVTNQNSLYGKLMEVLICPITSCPIIDPYLTPCGYTVDKTTMQKLINDNKKDPFTMTKKCSIYVPNYFAKQVIEILNS